MCCGEQSRPAGVSIPGEPTGRFGPQLRPGIRFERVAAANALVDRDEKVGGLLGTGKRHYPRGGPQLEIFRGSEHG